MQPRNEKEVKIILSKERIERIAVNLKSETNFNWSVNSTSCRDKILLILDSLNYDYEKRSNPFTEYLKKNKIALKKDNRQKIEEQDAREKLIQFFKSLNVTIDQKFIMKASFHTEFSIEISNDHANTMDLIKLDLEKQKIKEYAILLRQFKQSKEGMFFSLLPGEILHKILSFTAESKNGIDQQEIDEFSARNFGYPNRN